VIGFVVFATLLPILETTNVMQLARRQPGNQATREQERRPDRLRDRVFP